MHTAIIIGTGFSGLCQAIKLKEKGIHDFVILEKANDIGGTWRENTYPGAECDVPSALYSYSFEPYPFWEYKWSHQPQILEYLKMCSDKYSIDAHIHFNKEMTGAIWNEKEHFWTVKCKDGSTYTTQNLIIAIGQLHHPSIPNFEGKENFEGVQFHSAKWNHEVDLKDKKVGVIGNAASAIQFIPEIQKIAKQVIVFQRSANWMLPKQDRLYKDWEKKLVRKLPILLKTYRLRLWLMGGALYFMMKGKKSVLRTIYQFLSKRYVKRTIDDPALRKKLIPNFPLGAKRLLFSDNYYDALNEKNVEVVTDSIKQITTKGIQTKSNHYDLEALIFATGFIANPFLLNIELIGKNGKSIQKDWKDGQKAYLGITVSNFPNLFLMYGPNTNLGHNSIIIMSEAQANYIAQCIDKMQKNRWKALEIKPEIMENYYASIQKRLQKMIWAKIENSWYKSPSGNHIPNNYPGRTMEYVRLTKNVDFTKFEIVE
jgi:cation diffusion facilitator CzcD-associated flavoprotein CzcO